MAGQKQLDFEFNDNSLTYPCADMQWLQYSPIEVETQKPQVVVSKLWDIRKLDLERFDGDTLEDIFYGVHNLWVPTQMLDIENPAEIIANYLACGILKRNNAHKNNDGIPRGSFSELVKYMNNIAYSYPIFLRKYREFRTRFPATPGKQEERLAGLDGEVKRKFCASFWRNYTPSRREEPNNPEAFHDPMNQRGYVNFVYRHLRRRFEREHAEQ